VVDQARKKMFNAGRYESGFGDARKNRPQPADRRCVKRPRVLICLCLALSMFLAASNMRTQQHPAAGGSPLPGTFVDVTAKKGIDFVGIASHTSRKYLLETMGSGVAMFDYDNDGLLDLFFVNGASLDDPTAKGTVPQKRGPKEWNRLYHQRKDGTFEDVTEKAGLQGVGYGMGVAVGDYDNDGYEDLYVTGYGGNRLYHNNGNGTFTDVTLKSGTGGDTMAGDAWYTSAAWVDLDNDGLLDLVVLRYVHWDFEDVYCGEHREGYRSYCHPDLFPAISPLVYHNNGDGTFTEISPRPVWASPARDWVLRLLIMTTTERSTWRSRTIQCRNSSITIRAMGHLRKQD
jgi:hypothetical protein